MPGDHRAAIAQRGRRHGVRAVIDESTAELRLEGPVEAPFVATAADAVTIGSASKAYWGGLRIGWIRAPRELDPAAGRATGHPRRGLALRRAGGAGPTSDRFRTAAGRAGWPAGANGTDSSPISPSGFRPAGASLPGGLVLWAELPTESSTRLAMAAERRGC